MPFFDILVLPAVAIALSQASASSDPLQEQPIMGLEVRTTAYTHTESDHLAYGKKSAASNTLKATTEYNSAAADWSRFPLGTVFRVKGEATTYVIDDYGSALVGTNTIDIYRPTEKAMDHWGVRHLDIEILKMGDYEKSRQILKARTHFRHCREMHNALSALAITE